MDGVIIDSEPTHQSLEFEMYKELGLNKQWEELQITNFNTVAANYILN